HTALLRFRAARAIRTEIPAALQRAAAVRAAAALALAAARTRDEIDADRRPAPRAERPHLAHFGDDAQELLGRRDAALHFREAVLAEGDHPVGHGDVAELRFGFPRGNRAAQLVVDAHHLVDADASLVSRVIALLAADGLVEPDRRRFVLGDVHRAQDFGRRRVLAAAVRAEPPDE